MPVATLGAIYKQRYLLTEQYYIQPKVKFSAIKVVSAAIKCVTLGKSLSLF